MKEETLASERIFSGRIIGVRRDTVRLPNGRESTREVVEHPGAVTILPMPDPHTVILVRQYRYAVGETLLELPAGSLGKGEDPADCARRELAEECGFRPGKLEKLVEFYAAPGYCDELLHLFLATELVPEKADGDEDEFIEIETLPLSDALNLIAAGKIRDAKSIIGLLMAAQRSR